MSVYSIKDLEHLSGIKAHTLRIWEQRYNFIKPKRTVTNIRYYDDDDLKLVLNISLLKNSGLKISKISKMSLQEMSQEVLRLTDQNLGFPEQIHALTLSMIDLNEERFEKILATNILQLGFEKTMIKIIFPFLTKIGVLWQTGSISPSHEHFITHLVRQKIIVAVDGQFISNNEYHKKYMLFTPEGELHELSLLFASYLIKARKNKVVYLGQSLPFADLASVHQIHEPDFLFSVITSTPGQDKIQAYVDDLANTFPNTTVLLTGFQVVGQDIKCPSNVIIVNRLEELIDFIEVSNNKVATE